jgi:hypothetical protein
MTTFENALSTMNNGGKVTRAAWDKGSAMYADEHGQFMRTPAHNSSMPHYGWILDMRDITATDWRVVRA